MNQDKLKQAEAQFLRRYPEGFHDPDLVSIGKKHKMDQMIEQAQAALAKPCFNDIDALAEAMVKLISRSSMVSMFEKPKFRDLVKTLQPQEKALLVNGLKDFLHGNQEKGFDNMVGVLKPYKLAKWSLVTILPAYYKPQTEVFVKPTTAKGVIKHFELSGLDYHATPSWPFYQRYREQILSMRDQVNPLLTLNTAAFCGFLMMTMDT